MAFLTPAQMGTHIYPGVADAIADGNVTLMQNAIDAAITEAKGYLNRYDLETVFVDDNSSPIDPTLLLHVKSMTRWHFMAVAGANINYEDANLRYTQALDWLKGIQAGKITPPNWPPAIPEEQSTYFHINSNPKRGNHY